MKHLLLAATALVGMSTIASAADLPRREYAPAPAVAVAPAFSWTGFYVGAHAGGVVGGDFRLSDVDVPAPATTTLSAGGFVVGGQAGYNYQFTPGSGIVVGIEGDAAYSDIHNDSPSIRVKTDGFYATARGRLGYAFDRFLVYGTGGYAYTDTSIALAVPGVATFGASQGLDGYTVGGGIEAAVFGNMSVKAEYLYAKFDGKNYNLGTAATGPLPIRGELEAHTLKVGLNYRFNGLGGF